MRRTETPKPIWIKFCTVVDIPNVVTYTNFGDHRLRGFWVAGGQISPSPIDFHRRPYNTLTLLCERVINNKANGVAFVQLRSPCGTVTYDVCIRVSSNANFYFSSEIYFNFFLDIYLHVNCLSHFVTLTQWPF